MRLPLSSDQVRKRKHKSKHAEIMAEWAELAKEEQMARRMRKGKMTEVRRSFFLPLRAARMALTTALLVPTGGVRQASVWRR